jgi:hypothetical protein
MTKRIFIYFYLPLILLALSGCFNGAPDAGQKKWKLHPDDPKLPYGDYLAFASLKYFFPGASIEALPQTFRYSSMDNRMKYNFTGHSLLVLEGLDFYVSDEEWKDLKAFINNGNEVVIFCSRLDSKIEQELDCYKERKSEEEQIFYDSIPEKENEKVLNTMAEVFIRYGYKGRSIRGYFSLKNTGTTDSSNSVNSGFFAGHPDTLGFAISCSRMAMKIISPPFGKPCRKI